MTSPRAPHPSTLGIAPGDLWVFGYGSLMWDPGFPFRRWAPALIFGYHRALCIASNRWRGTPERPGLVLGLERGGACHGIAFRVAQRDVATVLDALWAREMRRPVYRARLVRTRLPDREVKALAFIVSAHACRPCRGTYDRGDCPPHRQLPRRARTQSRLPGPNHKPSRRTRRARPQSIARAGRRA